MKRKLPKQPEAAREAAYLHPNQERFLECRAAFAPARGILYEDPGFLASLDAKLDRLLARRRFLSLDVFDTLLNRQNESELSRFVEIGREFARYLNDTAEPARVVEPIDGFFARWMGTRITYARRPKVSGCREGSLAEIHAIAAAMLLGRPEARAVRAFGEIELEVEARHLSVSQFWLERMKRHRDNGGTCILVTDMYMHESDVWKLLEKLAFPTDLVERIFSSADRIVSKKSGRIFRLIERELTAAPEDFLHVGDNFLSDYVRARQAGWEALHLPVPDCELAQRAADHDETAAWLLEEYGYRTEIVCPYRNLVRAGSETGPVAGERA